MLVPSAVCSYLAYWQYQRSLWKEGLIEEREKTLAAPAVDVYGLDTLTPQQKVTASGRYVHERSVFVGPRPRSLPGHGMQSGYFLITPLYDPVRKGAVLVNRGWVPASWLDDIAAVSKAYDAQPPAADASAAQPAASSKGGWFSKGASKVGSSSAPTLQVTGVIQDNENPSAVLPDNVPERLEFHWVDVPTLARAVGLPPDTPLVQVISEDPATQQQARKGANPLQQARSSMPAGTGAIQYPIPKNTHDLLHFTTMPRDHLIYAGIWTSLCVGLGLMAHRVIFYPPKTIRMVGGGNSNRELWARAGGSSGASAGQQQQPPKA